MKSTISLSFENLTEMWLQFQYQKVDSVPVTFQKTRLYNSETNSKYISWSGGSYPVCVLKRIGRFRKCNPKISQQH